MSSNNLWQICHPKVRGNCHLTKQLVGVIRDQNMTSKQIAGDLAISTERVRNWYYRNTGMTALDLLLLMGEYNFIRIFVYRAVLAYDVFKR